MRRIMRRRSSSRRGSSSAQAGSPNLHDAQTAAANPSGRSACARGRVGMTAQPLTRHTATYPQRGASTTPAFCVPPSCVTPCERPARSVHRRFAEVKRPRCRKRARNCGAADLARGGAERASKLSDVSASAEGPMPGAATREVALLLQLVDL